jgi:hypothetical protein
MDLIISEAIGLIYNLIFTILINSAIVFVNTIALFVYPA